MLKLFKMRNKTGIYSDVRASATHPFLWKTPLFHGNVQKMFLIFQISQEKSGNHRKSPEIARKPRKKSLEN